MNRIQVLAVTLLPLALLACSGDDGDDVVDIPDAGPRADAGSPDAGDTTDAGPPDAGAGPVCEVAALPEFGFAGGPIAGTVYVHVLDPNDRTPLTEVNVIVQGNGIEETKLTGTDGCASFDIANGPVDVHVMASNRVFFTTLGLEAMNLTVGPNVVGQGAPVDLATISGDVVALDMVPTTTTASIARAGIVNAITTSVFNGVGAPQMQPMRQGGMFGNNIVLEGAGRDFTDYALTVFPGFTTGLFVTAGEVQFPGIGNPEFNATHMGFLTGITVAPDEMLTAQDIPVSNVIDTATFDIAYQNGNGGLGTENVFGFLFFPDGGSVFLGGVAGANGMGSVQAPDLTGPLVGATYAGGVQVQDAPMNPTRLSLLLNPGTAANALDLGAVPDAPSVPTNAGRTISTTLIDHDMTFMFLNSGNATVWVIGAVEESGNFSVTLPDVPAGVTDPVVGQLGVFLQQRTYETFDPATSQGEYGLGLNVRSFGTASGNLGF